MAHTKSRKVLLRLDTKSQYTGGPGTKGPQTTEGSLGDPRVPARASPPLANTLHALFDVKHLASGCWQT